MEENTNQSELDNTIASYECVTIAQEVVDLDVDNALNGEKNSIDFGQEHVFEKKTVSPKLGWNFGAFYFPLIWCLANKLGALAIFALIPYANIVFMFVLGAKGNKWAWEKGGWRSAERFNRVQKVWNIVGIVFTCLNVAVFAFVIICGLRS